MRVLRRPIFCSEKQRREKMAGLIMWLMGVPLIIIILLYMAF